MKKTVYAGVCVVFSVVMCFFLLAGITGAQLSEQLAAVFYSTPGNFTQNQPVAVCVGEFPGVTLTWSPSANAGSYQIQRKNDLSAPWSTILLDVQVKTITSYKDVRFKADYGAIPTMYRIIAVNGTKKTYSNEVIIQIPECRPARLALIPPTVQTSPVATTSVPASTTTSSGTPTSPTTSTFINSKMPAGMKWGAYVGWQDNSTLDFENLVGKKFDMEMVFSHWGNDATFPTEYNTRIRDKGRTMVLFWEAVDYRNDYMLQPQYSFDAVLSGKLDTYFKTFASGAKNYNGPVIIALYSEFNGNWFPWGGVVGTNTPQKFIDSYRYIRAFFKDVPNVKFAWVPNSDSVPNTAANQPELFYPGDAYVDYVGVDGFNFGGAAEMTFSQIFSKSLTGMKKYNKPVYIFSMGASESATKAAWITNALTVELYKYPEVKGWLWFNESKEKDWRVNSSVASLAAFKSALP